jgi:hypothetical protein
MADQVRDAAFWKRQRDEMNAVCGAAKKEFDRLERRKQEIKARLRAEQRPPAAPIEIRWNAVSVPVTSGSGGSVLTVAASPPARKRRRWRWL